MHKETLFILYKDSFNGHILSLEYCCDVTSVFHVEYCDDSVQVHMRNFYSFFFCMPSSTTAVTPKLRDLWGCLCMRAHHIFWGLAVDAVMWKLVSFKQINNQASERKKEETNTNTKTSEQSINAQIFEIVFVVSAAWRRNRSKLACWGSFSSFLRPGGEIALNWPPEGRFRRFCGLAAKSV